MAYQIIVRECDSGNLESELDKPASQGWQLVSCWPSGQKVTAVFQRPRTMASLPSERENVETLPPPTGDDLLDTVISLCQRQPQKTGPSGKLLPHAIKLESLAAALDLKPKVLLNQLKQLGIKERDPKNPTNTKNKDLCHKGTFVWIYDGKFLNCREARKSGSAGQ